MHRVLSSTMACTLALALVGCGKSEQGAQVAAQPATSPIAASTAAGHAGMADGDQAFVTEATGDGAFEIALGHMALEKSSTDQMHALAQRMVEDRTRMEAELASITGRKGAGEAPPAMPVAKAQQLRNRLTPLLGDAFRNAFVDVTRPQRDRVPVLARPHHPQLLVSRGPPESSTHLTTRHPSPSFSHRERHTIPSEVNPSQAQQARNPLQLGSPQELAGRPRNLHTHRRHGQWVMRLRQHRQALYRPHLALVQVLARGHHLEAQPAANVRDARKHSFLVLNSGSS